MKMRFGFVSNSSSSSFVIPRKCMGDADIKRWHELERREMFSGSWESDFRSSRLYIFGFVSNHDTEMRDFLKRFENCDGAEVGDY